MNKGDHMAKDKNKTIDQIVEEARSYLGEDEIAFIYRAYEFAKEAHKGQYRKSGEAYIIHPVQVAGILVELEMDHETVAGGFLHDVVEDTEISLKKIKEKLNEKFTQ